MTKKKNPADLKKVGRPTDYKPEYCEKIIELGRLGMSKAQMAREFDVARMTLENWAAENPKFLDALTRARDLALAQWEDRGDQGLELQGFNAGLYAKIMSSRFPGDYSDHKKVELTGKDGAPLNSGGVFVIGGTMTPEEWEAAAKAQQAQITSGT